MERVRFKRKTLLIGIICLIVVGTSLSAFALAHRTESTAIHTDATKTAFVAATPTVMATSPIMDVRTQPTAIPTPQPTPTSVPTTAPSATAVPTGAVTTTTNPTTGQTLIWSDEFQGAAGTPPDATKWGPDVGNGGSNAGWGNLQLEYDTDNHNAYQDGQGNLVIEARKENPANYTCWNGPCAYTSARLTTSGKLSTQTEGRVEARLKFPSTQGIWPAFWMLGTNGKIWPNNGEVDIMENPGKDPTINYGSYHGPDLNGGGSYTLPNAASYSDDYHIFAVDWDHDKISYSVDNHVYETLYRSSVSASQWVFDGPFFIILNVAVGGTWPGSPAASTVFPQKMYVDYVRVYA